MEPENESVDWKEIGNKAFQEKRYADAVSAYSSGLKLTPSDPTLLTNRALNYLHLELWTLALTDADTALKTEPKNVKALYRKVKALIGSRKYRQAGDLVLRDDHKILLNSYAKGTKLGEDLVEEIESYLQQEVNGTYNMADIIKAKTYHHSVADYTAPIVMEEFPGRGRGLVTTQKVEAGQLLIGNKAYAFIVERKYRKLTPLPKPETPDSPAIPAPPEDLTVDRAKAKESLVQAIAQKIKQCPEETHVFYTLHAGSKLGHLDLDESCNSVDLERISRIVDSNALFSDGRQEFEYNELMAGLWLFPAFINHSCFDGNVKWNMHGDFLAVIATKEIAPGEELRMSYVSPLESLKSREELLANYGVSCDCSLCALQRSETAEVQEKVAASIEKFDALFELKGSMVSTETDEMEAVIAEMEEIHPGNQRHCPFLLEPFKFLAKRHFRAGNFARSIEILEKARSLVVGTDFSNAQLTFTTNIISAHLKNKDKKKASEWVEVLKKDVQICYGSPVDQVLQVIAPDLMKKLKLEKIIVS